MSKSVTFDGEEIALLAAMIIVTLPDLPPSDCDVADLLLDRLLSAFPYPVSAPLAARIETARSVARARHRLEA